MYYLSNFFEPSRGTGVPHLRSRVIQRCSSPDLIHDFAMAIAFEDQWEFSAVVTLLINSSTLGLNCFKSRNTWFEDFTTGVWEQMWHLGSISSTASMSFPHLSHWSPRASSYLQLGHVPETNRSAKNLSHFPQCSWSNDATEVYPLAWSFLKMSWAILKKLIRLYTSH